MSYRSDVEAREQEAREAEFEALCAREWLKFVDAHREVVPCEANYRAVRSYFGDEPLSLQALEESIQSPVLRQQIAFQTSTQDRAKSLEMIKRITGSVPKYEQYQTNEELANRAAELERKRELNKKSPEELRQIIRAGEPQTEEPDDLPAHMDRAYLLGLTKPGEFKKVVERWGSAAVTRRLNQR